MSNPPQIPVLVFIQSGEVVSVLAMNQIAEINTAKRNTLCIQFVGGSMMGPRESGYGLRPQTNAALHCARIALAMSRGESLAWIFDADADASPDSVDVLQTLTPEHLGL